ncbi:Lsr2 family protein [Arthrobacter sp. NamB2]|uniref:Lsr2 dimerization domain-containing protein n=1 Tax=Arthrobacter sp. NamB2 TaxID=2576035 RepID=UPI0010C99814|nr:Lsr2 family protein [Arthrobacter sp. NamB2]
MAYTRTAVLVELVDDLNGETAQEIVRSTVDGVGYEISLITEKAGVLRSFITEYASKGRKAGNREPGTGNREPGTGNREPGTGNREPEEWYSSSGVLGRCLWDRGRAEWSASDRATTGHAGTR